MSRVAEVLQQAHDLIATNHSVGRSFRDEKGQPCTMENAAYFDIMGAVMKYQTAHTGPLGTTTCTGILYKVLRSLKFEDTIYVFNDKYQLSDILQVMKMAIEEAKKVEK